MNLENLHKSINYSEINNERIKSYRARINNIIIGKVNTFH